VVTFQPTDKARVEVVTLTAEDTSSSRIEWPEAKWPMVEDLLAVDGKRLNCVELEPAQDMHRSILFKLPDSWALARVNCVVAHGRDEQRREWLSTKVVVRDESEARQEKRGGTP
jgi:hypothetical protein